jgi:hypothetical protein
MVRRDRCQRRLQIDFLAWGTGSVSRVADNRIGCSHDLLVFDGGQPAESGLAASAGRCVRSVMTWTGCPGEAGTPGGRWGTRRVGAKSVSYAYMDGRQKLRQTVQQRGFKLR